MAARRTLAILDGVKDSALRHFAVVIAAGLLLGGAVLLATGTQIGVGWGVLLAGFTLGWVCLETA